MHRFPVEKRFHVFEENLNQLLFENDYTNIKTHSLELLHLSFQQNMQGLQICLLTLKSSQRSDWDCPEKLIVKH